MSQWFSVKDSQGEKVCFHVWIMYMLVFDTSFYMCAYHTLISIYHYFYLIIIIYFLMITYIKNRICFHWIIVYQLLIICRGYNDVESIMRIVIFHTMECDRHVARSWNTVVLLESISCNRHAVSLSTKVTSFDRSVWFVNSNSYYIMVVPEVVS